jgi:hypothetical protein
MSYENAPATKILNINCAACGRPLVDANSTSVALGPDCRKKHGVPNVLDEATRAQANRLIWTAAQPNASTDTIRAALTELALIGCTALAKRMGERIGDASPVAAGRPCKIGDAWGVAIAGDVEVAPGDHVAVYARSGKKWIAKLKAQADGKWTTTRVRLNFPENAPELPAEPAPKPCPQAAAKWEGGCTKMPNGAWGVCIKNAGGLFIESGDIVRVSTRAGKTWLARVASMGPNSKWGPTAYTTRL